MRPIQLYKVDKGDKWQRKPEDIEDYVNKEVERIVESKEKEWKRKRKVIF